MDTSTQYAKMCESAVEIQKKWKPQRGDFYAWHRNSNGKFTIAIFNDNQEQDKENIWLPRQDQLQQMVYKREGSADFFTIQNMLNFVSFVSPNTFSGSIYVDEHYPVQFRSMEQLWLAFVMKKRYQKQWSIEKNDWASL